MNAHILQQTRSRRLSSSNPTPQFGWLAGVGLTVLLAGAGWLMSRIPGLGLLGPLACTLLVAGACRHLFGYPEALTAGIRFSGSRLLKLAIVLFGLRVPLDAIWRQGLPLLAGAGTVLAGSLAATVLIGRLLKADRQLTLLLAIGTGVCGATAIAAVAPLLAAREDRTAASVGLVAAAGTLLSVAYVLLAPVLPLAPERFGIWAGLTLHETAQVAMAAGAGGPAALDSGMLAKLSRVFLLVPLYITLHTLRWRARRRRSQDAAVQQGQQNAASAPFPWFLLGFVGMSLLASCLAAAGQPLPDSLTAGATQATTALLAVSMAGIGLNIDLRSLRSLLRPCAVLLLVSTLLSAITLAILL